MSVRPPNANANANADENFIQIFIFFINVPTVLAGLALTEELEIEFNYTVWLVKPSSTL